MYQKLNKDPKYSIAKILNYFSLFGTVPWYSLRQQKLVHKTAYKYYSVVLATLMSCISLLILYFRLSVLYKKEYLLEEFFRMTVELSLSISFLVTVLGSAFWNMRTWEKFLKQIVVIQNVRYSPKPYSARNGCIIFLLGNVFILCLYLGEFLVLENKLTFFYVFTSVYVLMYSQLTIAILVLDSTLSLSFGYRQVIDLLKSSRYGNVKTLKEVQSFFLILVDTVDNFNSLFGWPLLLILFSAIVNILEGLIIAVSTKYKWFSNGYITDDSVIILNSVYIIGSMVSSRLN